MTQEEVINIKVDDVLWTNQDKWIIRGHDDHLYLKPNKFYTVLKVTPTAVNWVKVLISTEIGPIEFIFLNDGKVFRSLPVNWFRDLNLLKEEDYLQISSIEYFV